MHLDLKSESSSVVIGIDVGGPKKGFHAVALSNGRYLDRWTSLKPKAMAKWCKEKEAVLVGVESPCRWGNGTGARLAERQLMDERVWCFSTPTKREALKHPKKYFHWMINGAALYHELQKDFTLVGDPLAASKKHCFETFPHAVAYFLLGGKAIMAKDKRRDRIRVLEAYGICTSQFTNMDWRDAALCALMAQIVLGGKVGDFNAFGEKETGFIVAPRLCPTEPLGG